MAAKLITTVRLSTNAILNNDQIIGAEYCAKGALRSDALLSKNDERPHEDFLFVNSKREPIRVFSKGAIHDANLLEAASVRVYRRRIG
jgi:hypothetical protein